MIPIKIKTALIVCLFLLIGTGYTHIKIYQMGKTTEALACHKEKMAAAARAIEEFNRTTKQNNEISEAYWQEQMSLKPKIETVEKRIIEYVETSNPTDCSFTPDELLILTDLVNITNGSAQTTD